MSANFPEFKTTLPQKEKELIDKVVETLLIGFVTATVYRIFLVQRVIVVTETK